MAAIECGAAERAEQLLASAPSAAEPQIEHVKGMLALAQHRFPEAAAIFESLLGGGVSAMAVRFNLAYARFRLGEHARAAQLFQDLLREEDSSAQTLAYLMRCLHHAGDPAGAVEAWRTAPARCKTAEASAVASLACLDSNQSDAALALAEQALRLDPPPLEALVVRATLAVGEGDTALAVELLNQAMARSPADGRVWSAMGAAWLLQGNVPAASQAFRRAVELLPQHTGSWVSLAWCQILQRDLAAARTSLDGALAIDRNFGEIHGALAVVAALEGRADEAREAIERAKRLDRNAAAARYAEFILSGKAQDPAAVQELARRVLQGRTGPGGSALLDRALQALARSS